MPLHTQATYTHAGSSIYSPLLAQRVLVQPQGGPPTWESHWFLQDALGSTLALLDSDESLLLQVMYDAWGNQLLDSGSLDTPYRYVGAYGYYRDLGTDLLYLWMRYYGPTVGRFTRRDPIQPNLYRYAPPYAYASGLPSSSIDPTGRVSARTAASRVCGMAWWGDFVPAGSWMFGGGVIGGVVGGIIGIGGGPEGFIGGVIGGGSVGATTAWWIERVIEFVDCACQIASTVEVGIEWGLWSGFIHGVFTLGDCATLSPAMDASPFWEGFMDVFDGYIENYAATGGLAGNWCAKVSPLPDLTPCQEWADDMRRSRQRRPGYRFVPDPPQHYWV